MATQPSSRILSFHAGGVDACGRTLTWIVRRDDGWLENKHDFIQWLFPLPEPDPRTDAGLLDIADQDGTIES